jgi:hypothetical protein
MTFRAIALTMEAVSTSENQSVCTTMERNIPEDSHLRRIIPPIGETKYPYKILVGKRPV